MNTNQLIDEMASRLKQIGSERFAYLVSQAICKSGPRGDGGNINYYHKAVSKSLKEYGEIDLLTRNGIGPYIVDVAPPANC
jgi:hypothetical protein